MPLPLINTSFSPRKLSRHQGGAALINTLLQQGVTASSGILNGFNRFWRSGVVQSKIKMAGPAWSQNSKIPSLRLPFPRPKRNYTDPHQKTRCQNDDNPSSPPADIGCRFLFQSKIFSLINTSLQRGATATHWDFNGFNRFPLLLPHATNSKIPHPIRQHLRRNLSPLRDRSLSLRPNPVGGCLFIAERATRTTFCFSAARDDRPSKFSTRVPSRAAEKQKEMTPDAVVCYKQRTPDGVTKRNKRRLGARYRIANTVPSTSNLTHFIRLNRPPTASFNAPNRHIGPVPQLTLVAPCNAFQTGQSWPRSFSQHAETKHCPHSASLRFRFLHERCQLGDCRSCLLTQNGKTNHCRSLIATAISYNRQCDRVSMQEPWQLRTRLEHPVFPFLVIICGPFQQPGHRICSYHPDCASCLLDLRRRVFIKTHRFSNRRSVYVPKTLPSDLQPLTQILPIVLRLLFPRPKRDHTNPNQNTHRHNGGNPSPSSSEFSCVFLFQSKMNSTSSGQDSRSLPSPWGDLGNHVVGFNCQTTVCTRSDFSQIWQRSACCWPDCTEANQQICLFFRGRRRLEDFQELWDSNSPFGSQNDKTALRQLPSVIPEFVKPKRDSFVLKPLRQLVESSRTCVYPQRRPVGDPFRQAIQCVGSDASYRGDFFGRVRIRFVPLLIRRTIQPLTQLLPIVLWLLFSRPKRNYTNPEQNTGRQNDDDPFPPHGLTLSNAAQLRNLFAPIFLPYLCRNCRTTVWSAPAERSGDGALAHQARSVSTKAVSRFACHRTPHVPLFSEHPPLHCSRGLLNFEHARGF
jgi:hypothetical protein